MNSTAEVLERAADLIVEHGWWDGSGFLDGSTPDPECGTHCALTAIAAAAPKDMSATLDRATRVFRAHVGARTSSITPATGRSLLHVGHSISAWNDAQPDGETVVAALRACAAQLREEGK